MSKLKQECRVADWKNHNSSCKIIKNVHTQVDIICSDRSLPERVHVFASGAFDPNMAFAAACKRSDFRTCLMNLMREYLSEYENLATGSGHLLLWTQHLIPELCFVKLSSDAWASMT
jgi:hypothetical protein